jgi:hypothetical protein
MSNQDPHGVVRVNNWTYEGGWPPKRRSGISSLGLFLIVVGVLLAAGDFFPEARIGASAFFMGVGVVLIVIGMRDHNSLALYAGVFVTAIALANLVTGTGSVQGPGWGILFVGIGFVAVALIRSSAGKRWSWLLGLSLVLVLWGGAEIAASNWKLSSDRIFVPVLIVLLGLFFVTRSMRARGR